jgi:tRNA (guanine9-N1)-methyltransferase
MSAAPSAERTPFLLDSGKLVYAVVGTKSDAEIQLHSSDELRPGMFSARPDELSGWRSMSKSSVKSALLEKQWEKLLAERARRKLVSSEAKSCVVPMKRTRATMESTVSTDVPEDDSPGAHSAAWMRRQAIKSQWLSNSSNGICIVLDCSFQELMTAGEQRSLNLQLTYSYGVNRRCIAPSRLVFTSFADAHLQQLRTIAGFETWACDIFRQPFAEVFSGEGPVLFTDVRVSDPTTGHPGGLAPLVSPGLRGLVYLTADSETVLQSLDPAAVYIVGGLVDRNRHKGITAARAAELGLATAKLPLDEFVDLKATRALTTNHGTILQVARRACGIMRHHWVCSC